MDLGSLLAESNRDAAREENYDIDEFEEDADDSHGVDKVAVLRAASAKVALEEKKIADRIFNTVADDIDTDLRSKKLDNRERERGRDNEVELKSKKVERDRDDELAILAAASREVNENYNKVDTVENADRYKTSPIGKEEKEHTPEPESEDDPDEGEDDEDEENDDALNTTLIFAVHDEKQEGVKKALKKGAYYFARDRRGWTPLHWAASKDNEDIIDILIEHVKKEGKNVSRYINSQDKIAGWTPLHVRTIIYCCVSTCCW
jgi:hypothetical protein